ncbi:transcriptional repressor [Candidatus Obscuribacterales bacterium]|jgi:Fe2+ or Zn2+ uptake regulation protein|nr:transcriptional repressor [Candidatus Obscuribacterales bacterium]MBX3148552.1 transcriptional repressor [Candidatus Obscuribacterales bacterium]
MSFTAKELLTKRGVKLTSQRLVITEYLMQTYEHPTADEILAAVAEKLPMALSRATVYNTLKTLVDAGVIREVLTEPGRTRYDANTSEHHHFVDVKSGRIVDIPQEMLPDIQKVLGDKYNVKSYTVTFYGDLNEDSK